MNPGVRYVVPLTAGVPWAHTAKSGAAPLATADPVTQEVEAP